VNQFTSPTGWLSYYCETGLHIEAGLWRSQMTAVAKVLSRAPATQGDVETWQAVVVFCGVGLVASLLLVLSGLDLSAGFF
jgi:hypothetical protein